VCAWAIPSSKRLVSSGTLPNFDHLLVLWWPSYLSLCILIHRLLVSEVFSEQVKPWRGWNKSHQLTYQYVEVRWIGAFATEVFSRRFFSVLQEEMLSDRQNSCDYSELQWSIRVQPSFGYEAVHTALHCTSYSQNMNGYTFHLVFANLVLCPCSAENKFYVCEAQKASITKFEKRGLR